MLIRHKIFLFVVALALICSVWANVEPKQTQPVESIPATIVNCREHSDCLKKEFCFREKTAKKGFCVRKFGRFCHSNADCDEEQTCIRSTALLSRTGYCKDKKKAKKIKQAHENDIIVRMIKQKMPISLYSVRIHKRIDALEGLQESEFEAITDSLPDTDGAASLFHHHGHDHDHDHEHGEECGTEILEYLEGPNTLSISTRKPKCGFGVCDFPHVRDVFKDPIHKNIHLQWLVNKGSWKNALKHIRASTYELNKLYAKRLGVMFISRVIIYSLARPDGARVKRVLLDKPRIAQASIKGDQHKKARKLRAKTRRALRRFYRKYKFAAAFTPLQLVKKIIGPNWQQQGSFQIVVADFKRPLLRGFARLPWKHDHGLVCMKPERIGKGAKTLMHEMGHAMGLLHTFQHSGECNACTEHEPSDLTGDLCSDTNPTPKTYKCEVPTIQKFPSVCGIRTNWTDAPVHNIMGYSRGCRSEITRCQARRARCWILHWRNKFYTDMTPQQKLDLASAKFDE